MTDLDPKTYWNICFTCLRLIEVDDVIHRAHWRVCSRECDDTAREKYWRELGE